MPLPATTPLYRRYLQPLALLLVCCAALTASADMAPESEPGTAQQPIALQLSVEERQFLAGLGLIRVGVENVGWPPFEQFDAQGNFHGIASDYLKALEAALGVDFQIVSNLGWEAMLQAMRQHDLDLLPAAASTPDRRVYIDFTAPYVRSPMIVVTRDDVDFIGNLQRLQGKSVGVVAGYASDELFTRHHATLDAKRYTSTIEGLKAVASGELYAFIDNLAAASHMIKIEGLANLKISGQTPYSFDLSIGVRNDWPLLRSAIDKALAAMPPEQHREIYDRWVQLTMTQQLPWRKLLPALLGALLLFAVLISYLLRLRVFNQRMQRSNLRLEQAEIELRETNRLLQELSVTDKLTGVFNRHHLDSVLSEEFERSQRYRRPLSLVLFDLDEFKLVNDRYGHQTGDTVLQCFAATAAANIRKSDVFGRWGGEEFLLICPELVANEAATVAEKIRQAMLSEKFEQGFTQRVSAGVIDNRAAADVDQLISAVDRQLYAAKLGGRDRVVVGDD